VIVLGVHILVVLGTNTVLNGLWTLTQNITGKTNRRKTTKPNIGAELKF
jgi:hypothetical protein